MEEERGEEGGAGLEEKEAREAVRDEEIER